MIRAAILSFLALLALPAQAIEIQEVTSPKGVEAWLVEDDSIPFVAIEFQFRGGASMDAPGKRGAVNMMTALLEEGAGTRDATAFARAVEDLGARLSFGANDDTVSVSLRSLTETRNDAAALLVDALSQPRFDDDAIERVRAQVQAVIRADASNPNAIAAQELARQIWGDHPYGSALSGTAESVAALTRQDLVSHRNRVLARDRVVVGAAGDIDAEALGLLIDKVLAGLPPEATAPLPESVAPSTEAGLSVIDWDSPQTVISFAGPGLAIDDPDYFAAFLANHILGGGGFSSRLMEEIRERRGLTYGVGTSLSSGLFGQSWQGGMATSNATAAEAVTLLRAEWARMGEGVLDSELELAKTFLTGEYALRFDGNGRIAAILAGMQLVGLPVDYIDSRNEKVEAVTSEDLRRVVSRLLDPAQLRIVMVGRPEGIAPDPAAD